jgi:uncharacterized membrane protein YfcA
MSPLEVSVLLAFGVLIGAYSVAIGAGGAFLVAPLLLVRYPDAEPELIATASLATVILSSGLSSVVVTREGRVDLRVGFAISAVAVPAALLAAAGTSLLPRDVFVMGIAFILVALAVWLAWRPHGPDPELSEHGWSRRIEDRTGNIFIYRVPVLRSILPLVIAAFIATLAGISGGPLKVPLLTRIMLMPHAIAVPTVHIANASAAGAAVALHLALGHGGEPLQAALWLGIGMVAANPLGQRARRSFGEGALTRLLALGLLGIGAQTAWGAL